MFDLSTVLGVEAMRPRSCPSCHAVRAPGGGRLLHGHGPRSREVVVPGKEQAAIVEVSVRRYRCTACRATCTVRPEGVLSRFLNSLYAIVNAWTLATPRPVGRGLDDAAVCALQGVDRLSPEPNRPGRLRWRSLARWAGFLATWWPGRAVAGSTWRQRVSSLLVGFAAEGDVTERAIASHAGWGSAM